MGNQEMIRKGLVDLGQRLRDVRIELRVPQKEIAAALEIEPGYLSDIDSGKVIPGADFFIKLADKYNVNPNYLLLGSGEIILGSDSEITDEEIDLEMEIDTIPRLLWLMERSRFFRSMVFASANKTLFEESVIIKQAIKARKFKKETKNEQTN